ncbi:MAG: TIGR03790 family protein, partial [Desulfobacterales bacterium]|nr:TIGR03790 family protein [Desulfobacterales bacterium]
MEQRKIPKDNLVLLFLTDKETCTREEYEHKAIPPVRRALEKNPVIRALVTIYGIPLRISSPGLSSEERLELDRLTNQRKKLAAELKQNKDRASDASKKRLDQIKQKIRYLKQSTDKVAAFDSELMLIKKKEYPLNFWLPNPFFLPWSKQEMSIDKSEVLMVSRLDGADSSVVKRIINDSIEAEFLGISGSAYFDARWKEPKSKKTSGYGIYDGSIHKAAKIVSEKTDLNVVVDDTKKLFQEGQSPNAALYCGWYSLAKYVDAFDWQKGAVGFHIASSECTTLKREKSRVWCKKMLDKG